MDTYLSYYYTLLLCGVMVLHLTLPDVSLFTAAVSHHYNAVSSTQESISDLGSFSPFSDIATTLQDDEMPIFISKTTEKPTKKTTQKTAKKTVAKGKKHQYAMFGVALAIFSLFLALVVKHIKEKWDPEYPIKMMFQSKARYLEELSDKLHRESGNWIWKFDSVPSVLVKGKALNRLEDRKKAQAAYKESELHKVFFNSKDKLLPPEQTKRTEKYRRNVWDNYIYRFVCANDQFTYDSSVEIFNRFKDTVTNVLPENHPLRSFNIESDDHLDFKQVLPNATIDDLKNTGVDEDIIMKVQYFSENAQSFANKIQQFAAGSKQLSEFLKPKYGMFTAPNYTIDEFLRGKIDENQKQK